MVNRTCGKCALQEYNGGVCPIFERKFEPNEPACPDYQYEVFPCDICKRLTAFAIVQRIDGKISFLCPECGEKLYTCATCEKAKYCDFESNPSSLPKMVQKQSRQGNMISVMTVPNPERIRETCLKNCDCGSEEFGCMRKNVGCCDGKWEQIKL